MKPRQDVTKEKATIDGEIATLQENVAFKSVSLAAGFITGGFVNGWKAWKNSAGQTMDEVIRGDLSPFSILTSDDLVNPGVKKK